MGELRRANVILYKTVRAFKQPSEDGLVCVMLDIVGVHKTKVVGTKIGLKLLQDLSRLLYWQYSPPASTVPQMHQMWLVGQHVFQRDQKGNLLHQKNYLLIANLAKNQIDWVETRWEFCRPSGLQISAQWARYRSYQSNLIATSAWGGESKICSIFKYLGFGRLK